MNILVWMSKKKKRNIKMMRRNKTMMIMMKKSMKMILLKTLTKTMMKMMLKLQVKIIYLHHPIILLPRRSKLGPCCHLPLKLANLFFLPHRKIPNLQRLIIHHPLQHQMFVFHLLSKLLIPQLPLVHLPTLLISTPIPHPPLTLSMHHLSHQPPS